MLWVLGQDGGFYRTWGCLGWLKSLIFWGVCGILVFVELNAKRFFFGGSKNEY
jgi:hypothetical protein